jgi:hypothetical protein
VLGDPVVVMMVVMMSMVVSGDRHSTATDREGQRCNPGDDQPARPGQH